MTVEEFRRNKYLPFQWAQLLSENAILQTVLRLMEENHPARYAIRGDGNEDVSPTRAAIELGLTRGYSKYGDTLYLLGKPVTTVAASAPETSYEPPPQPQPQT